MRPSWVGFVFFVGVIGAFLSLMLEQSYIGSGETSVWNQVTAWYRVLTTATSLPNIIIEFVGTLPGFFNGIFRIITWDYAFFSGPFEYIRIFIFMPITAIMVYGFISLFLSLFRPSIT